MSTIPFTPIEGYLALPRVRPLVHVPAPFGRDWALLPPGYSLRAELKALYAAMLRTFCLSDQAIRSLCRWSPLGEQRVIAPAHEPRSAAIAAQAPSFDASPETAMHAADATPVIESIVRPAYGTRARGYGNPWGALAGGACVIGGAAVLAWVGFDHLAHRQMAAPVADRASGHRDSQSADLQTPATVTGRAVDTGALRVPAASAALAASAPERSRVQPTFAPASSLSAATVSTTASAQVQTRALPSAQARISADIAGSPRHNRLREKVVTLQEQNRQHSARFVTANPARHAAAVAANLPRIAVPRLAASLPPKPSAAGAYSPPAPTRLGVDEYAGVIMSAATHPRQMALPHASSATNASGTSETEWITRLSQRRVTEVPDQFAK
ncbi:hypothetical protein P0D71_28495 [Paraburkholderia sp. RL17-383-BIF-A]|uniref:hypothetical protein n=1 Tax=Paraburkholderia sp. RL17-383-BIF-A TaxID=3031631 RepID=UPI0038B76A74